ncbi:MAG: hypothetical protein ABW318_12980 [Vicinamibacterales bacterium]
MVEPSKSGAALKRALVDVAAAKGSERLIFEADPIIGQGVERIARPFSCHPGGILDAKLAIHEMALSDDEKRKLKVIWAEAMASARPDLEAAREKWLKVRGAEIAEDRKVSSLEGCRIAKREAAHFDAGELRDDYPIHLDSGEWATVYQILSDPDRYAWARCWSLDETTPRPGVGFLQPYPSRPDSLLGKPPGPWLHSFEHGGRYFRLRSVRAETERVVRQRAEQWHKGSAR